MPSAAADLPYVAVGSAKPPAYRSRPGAQAFGTPECRPSCTGSRGMLLGRGCGGPL